MPTDFYHWLLLASLKATFVLPIALLAVFVSRRTSSAVIGLLLACVLVSVPLSPFLDLIPGHIKMALPWLEITGAFSDDIPELVEYDKNHPIPIPASEIVLANESVWTKSRIAVSLWLVGAVGFMVVRLWRSMNSRLRFSSSRPVVPEDPVKIDFEALCHWAQVKRVPWLLYNDSIVGPQTTGVLRPSILLPSGFGDLPPDQRSMILLHELEHIRRRDIPWRLSLEVLAVVFWFHPLVWLVLKAYDLQVEKACDDAVLNAGYPAAQYGEALLASVRSRPTGVTSKVASPAQLRARMFSIVSKEKHRHALTRQSVLKFIGLFSLVIIPLGMVSFSPYSRELSYNVVDETEGLKALWKMELGRGGIVADSSGEDRHGKIYGARWVQDAQRGVCLSFDGVDDHLILRAPRANWTEKPFTVAMWLKPATGSDGGGLLLRGDLNQTWCSALGSNSGVGKKFGEREIMLAGSSFGDGTFHIKDPGLHLAFNYYDVGGSRSKAMLEPNEWSHLAMVWRPAGTSALVQLYLNGKPMPIEHAQAIQAGSSHDWPAQVWHFGLGESPVVSGNNYEGLVSDLVIYQKALLPKDIKRVMRGDFEIKGSFDSAD